MLQKYEQEEKRFLKQEVLLGIDTIEVVIDTQTILNKNNITFYSSNGNEVGKLVHRQGKKKGYNLILNLPRCVRQNNIQPFSVLDADKIYEMQENTDRRRIGVWAKTSTRAEAMALQKLMALPQYANYFKENQKKVIFENAQNPELIKHKKMVQPVIEKKQAELGLLFMQGFQLRNIEKHFSSDLKALQKDGDE